MIEYQAKFRIDLGKAIPAVDDLVTRINAALSACGHDEQLKCMSSFSMTLSVDRALTEEEEYKMKTMLAASVIKNMPKHDVRLVEFCRKSGNVSQSVS